MHLKRLLLSLTAIALTGCTTMTLPPASKNYEKISWQQRKADLNRIHNWNIDGAFSVTYEGKSHIASYTWRETGRSYQIKMNSSLNLYSLVVSGQPGRVTLWEASKKTLRASSAEKLLQQRLGWSLPISNLRFWIRGLPAPGQHRSKFDNFGHLIKLNQQGWQVLFSNYVNFKHTDVPRSLLIQGHGLAIKIVAKNWRP